ncbi:MAG: hexose kinase [Pseudomonadota bacterium]
MARLVTLTLNPALDMSSEATAVRAGGKLRCAAPRLDPGGGGVNVSRALRLLGGDSLAAVAVGGPSGAAFRALAEAEGLEALWLDAPGDTRRSLAVTDAGTGEQYRFVFPGEPWDADALDAALGGLEAALRPGDVVALSGSQPPGAPADLPLILAERLAARDVRLAVDTSGPALDAAAAGGGVPLALLRMDRGEAGGLLGVATPDAAQAEALARSLAARGAAEVAVVTLAGEGAIAATAAEAWRVTPPVVQVVSAVGAGDSFLAGFLGVMAAGGPLREALARAMAAAASAVTTPATALCDRASAEALYRRMSLTPLESST